MESRQWCAALVGVSEMNHWLMNRNWSLNVTRIRISHGAWIVAWMGAAVSLIIWCWVIPGPVGNPYRIDLDVYRTGAQVFLAGGELYRDLPALSDGTHLPFTYPPIAAIVFTVLALMPLWLASLSITVASIALMGITVSLVLKRLWPLPSQTHRWLTLMITTVSLWLFPVAATLQFGQINIILMGLIVLDFLVGERRRWGGVLLGLAIVIKLTPAVFFLLLVLRGSWAMGARTIATIVGFTGLGFAVLPSQSASYWTEILIDTERIGQPAYVMNQSIAGVLHRYGITSRAIWFGIALGIGLFIGWTVWRLLKAQAPTTALIVMGFAALLCSPVSWAHHWVWGIPLLIAIASFWFHTHQRRWLYAGIASFVYFLTYMLHWVPSRDGRELHWNWWQQIVGNSLFLWGIAVVALIAFSPVRLTPEAGAAAIPEPRDSPTH